MAARLSLVGALVIALAGVPDLVTAQGGRQGHEGHHAHDAARAQQSPADSDSGFAALQARGKVVMGVDQYASVHRFDALPDGGRIELRRPGETAPRCGRSGSISAASPGNSAPVTSRRRTPCTGSASRGAR